MDKVRKDEANPCSCRGAEYSVPLFSHENNLVMLRAKATASCQVNREDALRYLGYGGQVLDDVLKNRLEELAHHCETHIKPVFTWKIIAIDQEKSQWEGNNPQVVLKKSDLCFPGKSICHHLKGALYAACMACTLGMACERELQTLTSINALDAMLYGACANSLIEATAEEAQKDIAHEAALVGLSARMRFSPGYGDLPLSVQPIFLKELNAQKAIGLTINDNHLLIPTKSITAIVGLFDKQPPSTHANPCRECIAQDYCSYLERGITCYGK